MSADAGRRGSAHTSADTPCSGAGAGSIRPSSLMERTFTPAPSTQPQPSHSAWKQSCPPVAGARTSISALSADGSSLPTCTRLGVGRGPRPRSRAAPPSRPSRAVRAAARRSSRPQTRPRWVRDHPSYPLLQHARDDLRDALTPAEPRGQRQCRCVERLWVGGVGWLPWRASVAARVALVQRLASVSNQYRQWLGCLRRAASDEV